MIENKKYGQKEHLDYPLYGQKRKNCMWSGKFIDIYGIKG